MLSRVPYKKIGEGILIHVRVQPRASKSAIEIMGDKLKVWLKSPPVDNKANEELVEIIAGEFDVKKSSVSIIKGQASRDKVLLIRVPS